MINLKEIRKSCGYSQKELAEKLGIKQQQYSRYENGITKITLETFWQILKICNYTLEVKPNK